MTSWDIVWPESSYLYTMFYRNRPFPVGDNSGVILVPNGELIQIKKDLGKQLERNEVLGMREAYSRAVKYYVELFPAERAFYLFKGGLVSIHEYQHEHFIIEIGVRHETKEGLQAILEACKLPTTQLSEEEQRLKLFF